VVTILGCFLTLILGGIALLLLNAALFNWWAASGPPTPNPELYQQRGNRCFLGAAISFVSGVEVIRILASGRKQYRLQTLLLLPVVMAVLGALWALAISPGWTVLISVVATLVSWRLAMRRATAGRNSDCR
jgi:hypothetical protein